MLGGPARNANVDVRAHTHTHVCILIHTEARMRPRSHAAMVYWLCRLDPENRGYFTMRDWGRDEHNKQARCFVLRRMLRCRTSGLPFKVWDLEGCRIWQAGRHQLDCLAVGILWSCSVFPDAWG